MVALCHLGRDGGEGEEETGNVVLETHPAAQVSCHVIITWSSCDYVCVTLYHVITVCHYVTCVSTKNNSCFNSFMTTA